MGALSLVIFSARATPLPKRWYLQGFRRARFFERGIRLRDPDISGMSCRRGVAFRRLFAP
jgi:hypothetical protein